MKVNENSYEGWRRAGKRPLPEAGASRRRVRKLRPLQQTLSFSCGSDGQNERDQRIFWHVIGVFKLKKLPVRRKSDRQFFYSFIYQEVYKGIVEKKRVFGRKKEKSAVKYRVFLVDILYTGRYN